MEHFRHIHFHVFAKPADLPEELKGGGSFALLKVTPEDAVPLNEIIAFCELLRNKGERMNVDKYFEGNDEARKLFEALRDVIDSVGAAEMRVTKSQVAFHRKRAFAWAWIPGKYLRGRGAPLVLTLSFNRRDASPRWKEIVEPSPGRFTHHLELYSARDIDNEVHDWLREAWLNAAWSVLSVRMPRI